MQGFLINISGIFLFTMKAPHFDPIDLGFVLAHAAKTYELKVNMIDLFIYYRYGIFDMTFEWSLSCIVNRHPHETPNHSYNMQLGNFSDVDKFGFIDTVEDMLREETYEPRIIVLEQLLGYLKAFYRSKIIDDFLLDFES